VTVPRHGPLPKLLWAYLLLLTYLLHVNSFGLSLNSSHKFGLSPNLLDEASLGTSPKFRLSPSEKIDFTFWLNFGLSPNFELSLLTE